MLPLSIFVCQINVPDSNPRFRSRHSRYFVFPFILASACCWSRAEQQSVAEAESERWNWTLLEVSALSWAEIPLKLRCLGSRVWRSKGTCSEWEFPPLQSGMRSCVSIMRGCWPWDGQPRLVRGPACCVRLLSVNLVWNSPLISVVPANWAEHFSNTSKCQGFCGDYCPHKLSDRFRHKIFCSDWKTKLLISFLEAVEISFYVPLNFIAYYVETEKFFKSDDYIRELKEEF